MDRTPIPAPELEAVAVEGLSRGAFLMRGALATGALLGGSDNRKDGMALGY